MRNKSTISRELKRNSGNGCCIPSVAENINANLKVSHWGCGQNPGLLGGVRMYSYEEKKHALDVLKSLNGNTRVAVQALGYPSRTALIYRQREMRETGTV